MRISLSMLLAFIALAGCANTPPPFPSYRYAGIDLGATVRGKMDFVDRCLTIEPVLDGQRQPLVYLVMPLGTRLSAGTIIMPAENGGASFDVGTVAGFQGGYSTIDEKITWARNPGNCRGDAFIVNRTYL